MGFLSKLRAQSSPHPPHWSPSSVHGRTGTAVVAAEDNRARSASGNTPHVGRPSNGLKEFLFQLEGIGRGHLLDLGPARQSTLNFFIERGYKVYTEDLLTTWKNFLDSDERQVRELPPDANRPELTPAARAERFLQNTLQYPEGTFDALLLWDLLDYLDSDLVSRIAARMTSLVREGGAALAMFHMRKPETFHRYHILNAQSLELIPSSCPFAPQRVFQNREIADLFRLWRSSKTFVGRDQLREVVFMR
jgi:hypothetical protein